ncbi:hypothetical protein CJ030_MR7G005006 [Morella rubra]|uniref:RNase H type-1 domain-containing protein n=1 Tax=Morella rubra TaxID=262757 RepID=A0A6A1WU08_9ROSI|nr:hypothetical protein CJ030_MR7G005006 [Morella rubra]
MYREMIRNRSDPFAPVSVVWWRKLWKMRIHERLKLCLWKLMWDVIPTKGKVVERLGSREDEDVMCVLCGEVVETIHHLMLGCTVGRILWSQSPWALDTGAFLHRPLSCWLTSIIDPSTFPELPEDDYHQFQVIHHKAERMWDVTWWTRNQVIHHKAHLDLMVIVSQVHRLWREHLAAWQQKRQASIPSCWIPPKSGQFKVNFDVAVRDEFAVGAAVIKDSNGMIVGACVEKLDTEFPEDGEICAAYIGLLEAQRCGCRSIIVEGDSHLAIDAIRKYPEQLNWQSVGRIGDIVHLASAFDLCSFSFVFRGANEEAHHLARWAASRFLSGGHPDVHEHFPALYWVYAGTDPA